MAFSQAELFLEWTDISALKIVLQVTAAIVERETMFLKKTYQFTSVNRIISH